MPDGVTRAPVRPFCVQLKYHCLPAVFQGLDTLPKPSRQTLPRSRRPANAWESGAIR